MAAAVSRLFCGKRKGPGEERKTLLRRALRLSKKATGRKSNRNSEKELQVPDSFFLFIQNTVGPSGANAFAFCVVRLLPYPYTPTEAHSLPLQPFRQPPSVSKTEFFDTLKQPRSGQCFVRCGAAVFLKSRYFIAGTAAAAPRQSPGAARTNGENTAGYPPSCRCSSIRG